MNGLLEAIIRSAIAFVLVMAITRIMGKHTVARMTYYDFVASITLGAIAGNIAFNTHLNLWALISSLLTFCAIVLLVAFICLKSRKMRGWLSGKPTVVIENGKIMEHNLGKLQFSIDMLNEELREKDIFDPKEVEYAVLEMNGKLSVLKKPEYQPVLRKDLLPSASSEQIQFPVELIMDGKLLKQNLNRSALSPEWLTQELQKRGTSMDQVCYAVKGTNGDLYIDLYKDQIRHPIDRE